MSLVHWTENEPLSARWHSESGFPPPRRVIVADDRISAATAYRLACEGTALLWRGDYHGARRLLAALSRRTDRKAPGPAPTMAETFHAQRRFRAHRSRVLSRLLVLLEPDHTLALRRAPHVRQACTEAYGPPTGPTLIPLRDLLGALGAQQWRSKGVTVPALGAARIHPHYGVFAPVRGEYVDLVAQAPLPTASATLAPTAFDLGTGTGVLAAVLARRGVRRVIATDLSPRARACARDNVSRLGLADRVTVTGPELYPPGRAALIVCNPPWLPGRPASTLDQAVYDPGGAMLHAFLAGLPAHLEPGGEGWLILSDLAEHLGLRTRTELLGTIEQAGLKILSRTDTRPRHPRATDPSDPLHTARAAEVTSLWRLAPR
ncbi:methylase [Streptomyces fodineus]|uniref:Methylase n=1 Tax=Streptomyces fodineus TaxID=1904616 RepID=A0A1D7YDS1_9ACTN|nr:class I SAM-dependent methyltransferase [Streptomyces fodineus]AOR33701.1 methylase [Streptomyces fodineus]